MKIHDIIFGSLVMNIGTTKPFPVGKPLHTLCEIGNGSITFYDTLLARRETGPGVTSYYLCHPQLLKNIKDQERADIAWFQSEIEH